MALPACKHGFSEDQGCALCHFEPKPSDAQEIAEIMGWKVVQYGTATVYERIGGHETLPTFNPFVDANDDLAILEWVRDTERHDYSDDMFGKFIRAVSDRIWLPHVPPYNDQWWIYRVGDYARALLWVRRK